MNFTLESDFSPTGDQPQAIKELSNGIVSGDKHQTLLGVTGSGKTLTTAYLVSQCLKYRGHKNEKKFKALIFDSLNGLKVPTNAFGGDYIDINDEEGFIPLNPMQIRESSLNKAFLEKWIAGLCSGVSERDKELISMAVRANFENLAPEERSLHALREALGVDAFQDGLLAAKAGKKMVARLYLGFLP